MCIENLHTLIPHNVALFGYNVSKDGTNSCDIHGGDLQTTGRYEIYRNRLMFSQKDTQSLTARWMQKRQLFLQN